MRFVLLLSLCLGCAAGAPTTYNQSAFRPPPPPTLRPGVGLPQPHMPGQHVAPGIQPNPRPTRYLPPTREPGIWASERPPQQPLRSQPAPPLIVLGEELPHPASVKTAWDAQLALRCAMAIDTGAAIARVRGRVDDLPRDERRCLAAVMQLACMKWIEDLWTGGMAERTSRGEPERLLSHELRARARDSKQAALDVYNECGQLDGLTNEGKRLLTILRDARPDPITDDEGGSLQ